MFNELNRQLINMFGIEPEIILVSCEASIATEAVNYNSKNA